MDYQKIINSIRQRRQNQLIAAENFFLDALNRYPELKKADSEYRIATLHAQNGDDALVAEKALEKRDEVLKKLGLYERVYPAPLCNKCHDTCFCNGKICDCVLFSAMAKDMISFPLHDFSQIDYSLFSEKDKEVFEKTAAAYDIVFEKKFPDTKKRIFSLIGKSGTGKTFLASCAANAVLKKGRSVVFVTAFRFVSDAAKYHTTFNDTRDAFLQPYLDCDLLILDDLGTEAVYKNITLEYLYLIINERQLAGKHTMITSNLSIDALRARYGERIASRLLDKKTCFAIEFSGDDIRAHSL